AYASTSACVGPKPVRARRWRASALPSFGSVAAPAACAAANAIAHRAAMNGRALTPGRVVVASSRRRSVAILRVVGLAPDIAARAVLIAGERVAFDSRQVAVGEECAPFGADRALLGEKAPGFVSGQCARREALLDAGDLFVLALVKGGI